MTSGQSCINKLISSWPDQIRPCDARIKLHRNFRNLCFQASFSQNFQLAASLFYSIIRNFSYFRPKGCCCFYPVSCVFLLHMGLLITTYANLVNVWKTSGEAGDQWVKIQIWHCWRILKITIMIVMHIIIIMMMMQCKMWRNVTFYTHTVRLKGTDEFGIIFFCSEFCIHSQHSEVQN